jgi:hypothetical protein
MLRKQPGVSSFLNDIKKYLVKHTEFPQGIPAAKVIIFL